MTAKGVLVKDEPKWDEVDANDMVVTERLYAGHEIKDEIVLGPELVQMQDIAISTPSALNNMKEDQCEIKLTAEVSPVPESTNREEGFNCDINQEYNLRSCFVKLEQPPVEYMPACETCRLAFDCKTRLANHKCMPVKRNDVTCNICNKQFKYLSMLKKHLVIHSRRKEFECDICKKQFNRRRNLNVHKSLHREENLHQCVVCNKKIKLRYLKSHMKIHSCEKSHKSKISPTALEKCKSLTMHIKKKGAGEKPSYYPCDICNRSYKNSVSLTRHKLIHQETGTHQCSICSSQFTNKYTLLKHNQENHKKYYTCDYCTKQFSLKSNLAIHIRLHTGEKLYTCDICERQFTIKVSLAMHIPTHEKVKPLNCKICNIEITSNINWNKHMKSHKVLKLYNCYICSKNFAWKDALIKHQINHPEIKLQKLSIEKPQKLSIGKPQKLSIVTIHKCDICEKNFAWKDALNKHKIIHSVEST